MASAFLAAVRSHDDQSKVGAILVNSDKKEISRGYNGFCSGIPHEGLDTIRPEKYKWMVHAEANAISNLVIKPEQAYLYCTRMPCLNCAKLLWQNNIKDWFIPKNCIDFSDIKVKVKNYTNEEEKVLQLLLKNGLNISYVDFDIEDFIDLLKSKQQYFSYSG